MAHGHESYRANCLWQPSLFLQGLVQSLWSSHSANIVSTSFLSSLLSFLAFADKYAYEKHACVCGCVCVHGWLAGWLATWVDAWVWLVIKFQLMLAYFISIIASSKHLSIYSLLVSFLYLLSTGCLVRYLTDMNAQEQVELVRGASREVVSAAEALTPQVWSVEMRRFAK